MFKRILSLTVIVSFFLTTLGPLPQAHADTFLGLPAPGAMVLLSPSYSPVMIKGLKVHPENPLLFDFILDAGESGLKINSPEFKAESQKLIKYFLASLTIKEDDLWVNLSPYEKDRIIPQELGGTELGRDMLAQDYILKQLTASLIYPEKELGKKFWSRVYAQAQEKFGTTNIPVNTFNKVWIVADKAKVLEHDNAAYVVGAHLKVMLEQDYLSLEKHSAISTLPLATRNDVASIGANIVREIVLPQIEKEVNQGQNFALLRQIFYSMILASWYKIALKKAFLNQVYSDKGKTSGVLSADPDSKEKIYEQYLKAYKKGVFNYIKEDMDAISQQPIPRKYFSGGEKMRMQVGENLTFESEPSNGDVLPGTKSSFAMIAVKIGMMASLKAFSNKVVAAIKDRISPGDISPRKYIKLANDFVTGQNLGGYNFWIIKDAKSKEEARKIMSGRLEAWLTSNQKLIPGEYPETVFDIMRDSRNNLFNISQVEGGFKVEVDAAMAVAKTMTKQFVDSRIPEGQDSWIIEAGSWKDANLKLTGELISWLNHHESISAENVQARFDSMEEFLKVSSLEKDGLNKGKYKIEARDNAMLLDLQGIEINTVEDAIKAMNSIPPDQLEYAVKHSSLLPQDQKEFITLLDRDWEMADIDKKKALELMHGMNHTDDEFKTFVIELINIVKKSQPFVRGSYRGLKGALGFNLNKAAKKELYENYFSVGNYMLFSRQDMRTMAKNFLESRGEDFKVNGTNAEYAEESLKDHIIYWLKNRFRWMRPENAEIIAYQIIKFKWFKLVPIKSMPMDYYNVEATFSRASERAIATDFVDSHGDAFVIGTWSENQAKDEAKRQLRVWLNDNEWIPEEKVDTELDIIFNKWLGINWIGNGLFRVEVLPDLAMNGDSKADKAVAPSDEIGKVIIKDISEYKPKPGVTVTIDDAMRSDIEDMIDEIKSVNPIKLENDLNYTSLSDDQRRVFFSFKEDIMKRTDAQILDLIAETYPNGEFEDIFKEVMRNDQIRYDVNNKELSMYGKELQTKALTNLMAFIIFFSLYEMVFNLAHTHMPDLVRNAGSWTTVALMSWNFVFMIRNKIKLDHESDRAMSRVNKMEKEGLPVDGGIDLNAKNMGLDIAKDGKGIDMKFDSAMITEFQKGNFAGVEGIILNIVAIQSPLQLLGLGTK